jgi:hypothetical protein
MVSRGCQRSKSNVSSEWLGEQPMISGIAPGEYSSRAGAEVRIGKGRAVIMSQHDITHRKEKEYEQESEA